MNATTGLAIFFLVWWVSLFAVLPWGVRSQHESGERAPGTDPGAPTASRLGWKLLWTTLLAAGIYGIGYVIYIEGLIPLDRLTAPYDLSK
jgi:predicted secreted protein